MLRSLKRLLHFIALIVHQLRAPFTRPEAGSSRFLRDPETWRFLCSTQSGLILDGRGRKRLSQQDSFEHLAVISPSGGGKTSRFIIPNILAAKDCSLVITDPSGEIHALTSGHLLRQGYRIRVLNLENPSRGFGYNPVAKATTFLEIDKLAHLLMRSANPYVPPGQEVWYTGPESLMALLLRCLQHPDADPAWRNLHNLLHLIQHFGRDGRALEDFIARYHGNQPTLNQFKEFQAGNERMIASFLTMATNALRLLNNPEIAAMMARDQIDFDEPRQFKTAIFLIVPESDAKFYRFIVNCFYSQFFAAQKQLRYKTKGLPIFALLDEFGNSYIPEFETLATTIRKYRVSLSIIIQDIAQLREQYGANGAATILSGGIRTKLFYSGLDIETAKWVESMLGRVRIPYPAPSSAPVRHQEENLLNADRISRLPSRYCILIRANEEPVWFPTLPYYKLAALRRRTQIPAVPFPETSSETSLQYVPLLPPPFSDISQQALKLPGV